MDCPAARGRWRKWVGGASGERQSEKAGQQLHAEIDPRPDKEEEDDYGWLRDPSFIGPAVQSEAPPQSDASSPESGAPIVPRPPHSPAAMVGSGLIVHPVRHS